MALGWLSPCVLNNRDSTQSAASLAARLNRAIRVVVNAHSKRPGVSSALRKTPAAGPPCGDGPPRPRPGRNARPITLPRAFPDAPTAKTCPLPGPPVHSRPSFVRFETDRGLLILTGMRGRPRLVTPGRSTAHGTAGPRLPRFIPREDAGRLPGSLRSHADFRRYDTGRLCFAKRPSRRFAGGGPCLTQSARHRRQDAVSTPLALFNFPEQFHRESVPHDCAPEQRPPPHIFARAGPTPRDHRRAL